MVVIPDYEMGNIRSIAYKLEKCGAAVGVTKSHNDLLSASRIILPGVGHFGLAMKNLKRFDLIEPLTEAVLGKGIPVFGICLGFQLFGEYSEEGDSEGLGWIPAVVRRFSFETQAGDHSIPHVGWRPIQQKRESDYLAGLGNDALFYFTHSYHMCCTDTSDVVATAEYGIQFTAAVQKGCVFGTQFHPEKSHKRGFEILKRFALSNGPKAI